jgi:hypothetical protein
MPGSATQPFELRQGVARSAAQGRLLLPRPPQHPSVSPISQRASGAHTTCKQIGSFAQAQELLRQGHSDLDRNGDGVACESLR